MTSDIFFSVNAKSTPSSVSHETVPVIKDIFFALTYAVDIRRTSVTICTHYLEACSTPRVFNYH